MKYSIKAGAIDKINSECIVLIVWSKGALSDEAKLADKVGNKSIDKIVRTKDFTGKLGETHTIYNPAGLKSKRLLLLGGGEAKKLNPKNAAKMLKAGLQSTYKLNAASVHFALASIEIKNETPLWLYKRLTLESEAASYRYNETKSKKSKTVTTKQISVSFSYSLFLYQVLCPKS